MRGGMDYRRTTPHALRQCVAIGHVAGHRFRARGSNNARRSRRAGQRPDPVPGTDQGAGWSGQGYTAKAIRPDALGQAWLLAEGGLPRRMRCAYLTDAHIRVLINHAKHLRRHCAA
jgi:hypothetical protein